GVTAGKNVAVRANALGFGIDIGAHGNATLGGTLAQPTLDGRFDSTGGTLTFVDHAFKIREGNVVFNPRNGIVPELYAVGTTHVLNPDPNAGRNPSGSADITITVTGPATSPQLAFNSNPPGYSRDQIIGMLTPLGAVTGIQFDEFGNPVPQGQLAGAPPAGNAQPLPPGAVLRTNGQITVGQEAFNILNAQFARSLFTPVENVLGSGLGLSDVNLTLDYSGAVGLNFRKPISEKLYAVYATTFGYPSRQTYGFEYEPNALTAAQLAFFSQQQPVGFFSSAATLVTSNPRVTAGQPLYGSNGFTLTVQRLFW
ncbi:MAG: translocation/assembly module TamB domain-containing protein, partial [Candidatus Eremiobacteraeota bacterium]|nr:translocation/assembly module TamB domain-containing protein [Candidatus Eremiobacteraeota bacterium]